MVGAEAGEDEGNGPLPAAFAVGLAAVVLNEGGFPAGAVLAGETGEEESCFFSSKAAIRARIAANSSSVPVPGGVAGREEEGDCFAAAGAVGLGEEEEGRGGGGVKRGLLDGATGAEEGAFAAAGVGAGGRGEEAGLFASGRLSQIDARPKGEAGLEEGEEDELEAVGAGAAEGAVRGRGVEAGGAGGVGEA